MSKRRAQSKTSDQSAAAAAMPAISHPPSAISHSSPPSAVSPRNDGVVTLTAWLTVERLIWAFVIALAASVRLLDLAHVSLSDAEATLATAALALQQGDSEATLRVSPFALAANALIFTIFGANDVTARIVAALAGIAPVALTYRLRFALGRWGALIAASLFALSPTFLVASRSANGEIVAVAAAYAALVGAWEFLRQHDPRSLVWVAIGAAIALTAGQAAYTILLIVAAFAAIAFALRATGKLNVPEFDSAITTIRNSQIAIRNSLITFALVALVSATAALLNPLGIQATLNLAADWLAQWTKPTNQPASYFLQLLVTVELLPLVFGLAGLFYYLARGERQSPFFAWWLGVALAWYTLAPHKSASALMVILIPLILAAGRLIAEMVDALAHDFSLANEGVFITLGLLTCGIFGINLADYAQTNQSNHLIVAAIAVGMLLLIGVLVGGWAGLYRVAPQASENAATNEPRWQAGLTRALRVLGTIGLLALAAVSVHAALNLNFNDADDPRELMVDAPTTMEARGLRPLLEELSNRWEGDPHAAPVAASVNVGPALRWYLRDFRTVTWFDSVPSTAAEPIVIVPAQEKQQPGFVDYASQKMRWRWLKATEPLDGINFLRWWLYRGLKDVPPSYDIIVYVQKR